MTDISPDPMQVLRTVLETDNDALSELDEECSPTKTCRNMVGVTFDGFAEPGSDIGAAWRQKLAREGKLRTSGESLRDFVLRSPDQV
ncbi:MAG: hypothetical protein ABR76_05650 [Acidimicrobiia bacterium BACL6 MAG-121220-bin61]|jgi:hypothetical protein|uniref:Uncharacterized protein n=1 Tax=Acidimicrobiia bacterium BACL6 MAG-120924-bin43 TaxID=1655583 RepID=A0A0R2QK00_9ACTN|nr:MAG: hypothetical protein ABR75_02060 [Acidimicrobiia bacterium BACL6 MAG-120924-bin43]KRO52204.1 MAG: hypothetical protein ABR78_02310 [Acidimicrobiia bacterium BACL6 MAG-120910-bin40]KRO56136.1 MAG: hypothetical protein ABR77_09275 [Acidimicrobiia bacterium BACL6 MAG-120322-bin79]KRO63342.1 MAG: hypothetical protein ABR76_05650 [Acidimicrobiia bacterium BACL6 MAG-121220-bin61]